MVLDRLCDELELLLDPQLQVHQATELLLHLLFLSLVALLLDRLLNQLELEALL